MARLTHSPPSPSALPLALPQGFHLLRAQLWDTHLPWQFGKTGTKERHIWLLPWAEETSD